IVPPTSDNSTSLTLDDPISSPTRGGDFGEKGNSKAKVALPRSYDGSKAASQTKDRGNEACLGPRPLEPPKRRVRTAHFPYLSSVYGILIRGYLKILATLAKATQAPQTDELAVVSGVNSTVAVPHWSSALSEAPIREEREACAAYNRTNRSARRVRI